MCLHRPSSHYLLGVGGDALCRHITLPLGLLSSGRNLIGRESGSELLQSTSDHLFLRDRRRAISLSCSKDITTLFVGSMILAHSMEHVRLHRRLALFVLSLVGSSIKWSVFLSLSASCSSSLESLFAGCRSMAGLMGVTAFLSMWINNSAATSIMIPAAVAIVDELRTHREEAQRQATDFNAGLRRKSKEIVPIESTGQRRDSVFIHGEKNRAYCL